VTSSPDDQIGRLNLLTPGKVKQGIAEVKDGLSFCLSLPLDYPGEPSSTRAATATAQAHPRAASRSSTSHSTSSTPATPTSSATTSGDEPQYSTQDSFAHVGSWFDADGDGRPEMVYYNGYRRTSTSRAERLPVRRRSVRRPSCAEALGIENSRSRRSAARC
jgi:hypothetical protein